MSTLFSGISVSVIAQDVADLSAEYNGECMSFGEPSLLPVWREDLGTYTDFAWEYASEELLRAANVDFRMSLTDSELAEYVHLCEVIVGLAHKILPSVCS